jgi:DNA-directed RNA polymerase subunit RPC12/RpoP
MMMGMPPSDERKNFIGQGNDAFRCANCGSEVLPLVTGFRNHCPECLWCLHVDVVPGDRKNPCRGLMEPVALEGAEGSGWFLVHRCQTCGAKSRNGTSENDPRQPDSWDRLVEVTSASPPSPKSARRRR